MSIIGVDRLWLHSLKTGLGLLISLLMFSFLLQSCFHSTRCLCPKVGSQATQPENRAVRTASLKTTSSPPAVSQRFVLPEEIARVRFAAVGDVISHGDVLRSAADQDRKDKSGKSLNHYGFDELFSGISEDFRGIDLGFANLETPIAPKSGTKTVPFMFNAPPSLLYALKSMGIRMVSFANNHVYDQKRSGLVETLTYLKKAGLVFAGSDIDCSHAQAAKTIEVNGIKIAFIASSTLYNHRLNTNPNKPCASEFDEKTVLGEVTKARKAGADLVILSLHWGKEYHTSPEQENVELAHSLLEGGVDVLLGHHPHVLEPVEVYKATDGRVCIIAYSLGNFLSNQSRYYVHGLQPTRMGNSRDGVILRFSAVRKDYGEDLSRVELADLSVQPIWSENNALEYRKNKNLSRTIRPVADDRAADLVRGKLKCTKDPKVRVELVKKLRLYLDRRKIAGEILGEDLLREPVRVPEIKCNTVLTDSASPKVKAKNTHRKKIQKKSTEKSLKRSE